MGILPLQFMPDESAKSIGLTGYETFTIAGLKRPHSGSEGGGILSTP
jgi:aconitate hydratase